ncbi:hypothetical protein ACFQJD_19160 [Haloplanus sp. GCM10025708]|uniref:hypothetical protein n=1 Tax=Haloferacaceae TaxID=1644056 RepID=UPI003619BD4B
MGLAVTPGSRRLHHVPRRRRESVSRDTGVDELRPENRLHALGRLRDRFDCRPVDGSVKLFAVDFDRVDRLTVRDVSRAVVGQQPARVDGLAAPVDVAAAPDQSPRHAAFVAARPGGEVRDFDGFPVDRGKAGGGHAVGRRRVVRIADVRQSKDRTGRRRFVDDDRVEAVVGAVPFGVGWVLRSRIERRPVPRRVGPAVAGRLERSFVVGEPSLREVVDELFA